ncbi:MAG: hydroxyethylthiazole kinase [Smithellaceae bacterium]|nr:hydroxyethylthiazole kinase [Smithellaceae bacterium]
MDQAKHIWNDLEKIRAQAPLVHNITNYVVMNSSANALLSLGASPVMAHALEEVEEMVGIAQALVINIGTLSQPWIRSMITAAKAAKRRGIPLILDPVGAGATALRTKTALSLLIEAPATIIRGNASEIRSLYLAEGATKGVDSRHTAEDALGAAQALANLFGCVVSVSGPVDLIVGGDRVIRVTNGHPLMPRVTGLGCTASALTGAFAAVNPSPLHAAAHAMAIMGIAGEMAAERAEGPGTLQLYFLDALYRLSYDDIAKRLQWEE